MDNPGAVVAFISGCLVLLAIIVLVLIERKQNSPNKGQNSMGDGVGDLIEDIFDALDD